MRVIARFAQQHKAWNYADFRGQGSVVHLPSDKHPDKPWAVIAEAKPER